jgi:DNA-binding PadR family transcriptional regulator
MNKISYLGELEQMILWTVLRLGDGAYGLAVRDGLEQRAGRSVARGAVYTTLDRLVTKGYLIARLDDGDVQRAGRRRRYFAVTATGREALKDARDALMNLWTGLEGAVEKK